MENKVCNVRNSKRNHSDDELLTLKTGDAYISPTKLRILPESITKSRELRQAFEGIFPKDNPKVRFFINYFISVGLGSLIDELHDFLRIQPNQVSAVAKNIDQLSESSDSNDDSNSSTSNIN
ncbi:Hypothetical protein CINCED_3A025587 [Cinara cedri]|uniref:Uncharacterized protein n=1 Tax=Cinara cedri TaxID=506608 RepID=A0A5E4MIX1_9HEMI|nr:Hypothetical protein CINCED_3A025587 [Cinara cedri]